MSARLLFSAIEIRFAAQDFTGALIPYESDDAFHALRKRTDLLAYRRRGRPEDPQVLVVPTTNAPCEEITFGPLPVKDNLRALARFIEDRLVDLLPKFELRRTRWGVDRIRRKDDLLDAAFGHMRRPRPDRLAGFHKFHRTTFRVRHEHLPGRGGLLVLTVEFQRHQEIEPTIAELAGRGFNLNGLEVFARKEGTPKVWLGEIFHAEGETVTVNDGTHEATLDGRSHHVEPSTETFTTLFEQALGRDGYDLGACRTC